MKKFVDGGEKGATLSPHPTFHALSLSTFRHLMHIPLNCSTSLPLPKPFHYFLFLNFILRQSSGIFVFSGKSPPSFFCGPPKTDSFTVLCSLCVCGFVVCRALIPKPILVGPGPGVPTISYMTPPRRPA